jgi:hypothetical protein
LFARFGRLLGVRFKTIANERFGKNESGFVRIWLDLSAQLANEDPQGLPIVGMLRSPEKMKQLQVGYRLSLVHDELF